MWLGLDPGFSHDDVASVKQPQLPIGILMEISINLEELDTVQLHEIMTDLHAHPLAVSCGVRKPELLFHLILDIEP